MPTEDKGLMSQVQRRLQRSSRKTINPQKCGRRRRGDSQECRPVTHAALGSRAFRGLRVAARRPPPAALAFMRKSSSSTESCSKSSANTPPPPTRDPLPVGT